MMINKMPSSINEKAQSSTDPKAIGVKMIKRMRMSLMKRLSIAQSSKFKGKQKTETMTQSSKEYYNFLLEIELINPLSIDAISLACTSIFEYCSLEIQLFPQLLYSLPYVITIVCSAPKVPLLCLSFRA